MEIRILTQTLIGAFLLAAGTQKNLLPSTLPSYRTSINSTVPVRSAPFASPWEDPKDWSIKDSSGFKICTYQRSMPELTADIVKSGVVMVWAKNLVDPTLGIMDKPLLTPFYFFPDNEQPKYTEYWYPSTTVGAVALSFRANGDLTQEKLANKVKLRYLLIPKDVLQKNKLTAASVYKLSYTQLTNMLGIGQ